MSSDERTEDLSSSQGCLLVYDAQCRLCVFMKTKLEPLVVGKAGTDVRFVAYQSEEATKTLGQEYRVGRPDVALLIRPSGEVLQGLEAFLPFVPTLPGGRVLLWWLRFPSAKRLVDWSYRIVARHRYRWFGEAKPVGRQS